MRNLGALKTVLVLAALAVAATAMLAGCGSSSDETGETGETPASTSTAPAPAPLGARAKVCTDDSVSGGEVRVTGVHCGLGRLLVAGWYKNSECSSPAGASRTSCKLGNFTCLGLNADRGLAVTCAGPARSVAFVAKRPG